MSPNEIKINHERYKKLCNRVTNQVRKDTGQFNEERIDKAGDEKEILKFVNEVTKPKEKNQLNIKDGKEVIEKEEDIATSLITFSLKKCHYLRMELIKSMSKNHFPN